VSGPVDVGEGRRTTVGGMPVQRSLPQRHRRTIGPWCFVDHFGPADLRDASMQVGPHPHIGLHTVTWVLAGEVLHRDSLGSEQLIKPGQLNLMTAGRGVAHAEETPPGATGTLHGLQLWVAQPDATRAGDPAFAHHSSLPEAEVGPAVATVLVGELAGVRSPARADSPLIGADLVVLFVVDGPVTIGGMEVPSDAFAYLAPGRSEFGVTVTGGESGRALLLGGTPLDEPILMWWNFVARTKDEMVEARSAWEAGSDRFGAVQSGLGRIAAPPPLWDRPGMQPIQK
jgi:quercetin 2,3-dioxygenase